MTDLLIRPASPSDLTAVCAIENDSFPSPYPRLLLERLLQYNRDTFLVAINGYGVLVGYCVCSIERDSAHLISIAVHRASRRKGYATVMMKRIISQMVERDIGVVRLEVSVGNSEAISLYSKSGFEKLGVLANYYSDGSDALRMQLKIANAAHRVLDGDKRS